MEQENNIVKNIPSWYNDIVNQPIKFLLSAKQTFFNSINKYLHNVSKCFIFKK